MADAEDITPSQIMFWLGEPDEWTLATKNRYIALMMLNYKLAEVAQKIKYNPARLVWQQNNERIRYLNQYKPAATHIEYLKDCKDEESRHAQSSSTTARNT